MKTVWYETLKAYVNKLLPAVILLAFLINGALLSQSISRGYPGSFILQHKEVYERLLGEYKDMPAEQAYAEISERHEELQAFVMFRMLAENLFGEPQEMIDEQLRQIEEARPGVTKRYNEGGYTLYSGDIHTDYAITQNLYEKISYIHGYPDYIATMTDRMNEMLSVSIFYREGTFAYRNIVRTPQDFAALRDAPLKLGLDEGVIASTKFAATDVFMIGIAFLLCIYLIAYEKDRKLLPLVKSTRGGRGRTIAAKLGTLALSVCTASALLYGSNLLLAAQTLGLGDLSRPVQSLSDFRGCSIPLTVGQYLGLFLISKTAAAVLVSMLFFAVMLLCSNSSFAYAVIAAGLAAEWAAWKFIPVTSWVNHLKFLNVFGFMDAFGLYSNYQNLNLFGYPANVRLLFLVIVPLALALLAALCCLAFTKLRYNEKISLLARATDRVRLWLGKLPGTVGLFLHEAYKLLIAQKALLILLALLAFEIHSVSQFFVVKYSDRVIYGHYLAQVQGGLTEETRAYIAAEQANFDNAAAVLAQAGEDLAGGRITQREYDGFVARGAVLQDRAAAFGWLTTQYEYLEGLRRERGIDAWFVDPAGYAQLLSLNGYSGDLSNHLLLTAAIIACLAAAFAQENAIRARNIIVTCRHGRGRTVMKKALAGAVVAVAAAALVYGAQLYNLLKWYDLSGWGAPVQSVMAFDTNGPRAAQWLQDFPLRLTIGQYALVLYGIRLLGVAAMASAVLLVSSLCGGVFTSIFASTALLEAPALLYLLGVTGAKYFSFLAPLSGNMLLAGGNTSLLLAAYPAACIGFIALMLVLTRRAFVKARFG